MAAPRGEQERLQTEIWKVLYELFLTAHEQNLEAAGTLGVSPGDLKALMRLVPGRGASMRELAEVWRCDASTVTWIVDRLEKQDLAERRQHGSDRRIKVVALTKKGEHLREQLLQRLYEPPAEFGRLSVPQLRTLQKLAARLRSGRM